MFLLFWMFKEECQAREFFDQILFGCFPCRRIKPKVLQNRFYADSGYDRELRAFCLETR